MSVTERQDPRWPSAANPGDLSRRVARRRVELHLSRAQVAARTGMNARYLEYLERYPARPNTRSLRQLATALRTTPAVLLGGDADTPPGQVRLDGPPVFAKLTPADCRRLIAPGGVGRIAFCTAAGPAVFPVNFAMVDATIVIRTSDGTVIDGHGDGPVAFEVDHIDEALCQGWSVLVRGLAHHVRHPAELHRMRSEAAVWPWPGGEH
jgi:transcriptional regulator with XRE-family HTH domain